MQNLSQRPIYPVVLLAKGTLHCNKGGELALIFLSPILSIHLVHRSSCDSMSVKSQLLLNRVQKPLQVVRTEGGKVHINV